MAAFVGRLPRTQSTGAPGQPPVELKQELFGGTLMVRAQAAGTTYEPQTDSVAAPPLEIDLLPHIADPIVPGSLIFQWGGETYIDRSGVLFRAVSTTTNAGSAVGAIDYATGIATLQTYPAAQGGAVSRIAALTENGGFSTTMVTFRTPGAPLRPASLQITAVRADTSEVITGTADLNGNITGGGGVIHGEVDIQSGIGRLLFSTNPEDLTGASDVPVIALLVTYNAVVQVSMPMSADLLGLDPVRLPADGRVPIYREGDVLVIHHTVEHAVVPVAGAKITFDRAYQADVKVVDSRGVPMNPNQYSTDREAGTLTWADPVLLVDAEDNMLTPPLTIRERVEHMTVCTEVQITGAVSFGSPLPWDLPADETMVSSAVTWGDLQARVYRWFTQQTWNQGAPNWGDTPIGNATTAQYNQLNYPFEITNMGSIAGKWALVFTSATTFNVVEQQLGVIATGNISTDCSPINPATGVPYFTIRAAGWGTGWASGNAVRFNTDACLGPMWVVRTVISGQGTVDDDKLKLQIRGDAD